MVGARGGPALWCAIVAVLCTIAPLPLAAQARIDGEIETLNTLAWNGAKDELGLLGYGRGELDLRSERDRNVQARLTLDAVLGETTGSNTGDTEQAATVTVPRASIRFRFPLTEDYTVRVTSGRDRVSWGMGRLFNAADVIFGADGTGAADFFEISDDLRNETTWLSAVYVPLGSFSYFEPIILPDLPTEGSPSTGSGDEPSELSSSRAGGRLSFELGNFTLEPAYLYDGTSGRHETVLTVVGLIGVDVYGAGRLSIDGDIGGDADGDAVDERATFSLGAYNRFTLGREVDLDARLEALIRPGGAWEDKNDPQGEYGLTLYPELVLSPGRTVSVVLRSIVSPIDLSAYMSTGVSWNVYGGFELVAFAGVQSGDNTNVFAWERSGAATLSTGFTYSF